MIKIDNILGSVQLFSLYKYGENGRIDFYSYRKEFDKNGILIKETEPELMSSLIPERVEKLSFFYKIINWLFK